MDAERFSILNPRPSDQELKVNYNLKLEREEKLLAVMFHFDFVDDSIVFRKRLNWHFKAFLNVSKKCVKIKFASSFF